MLFATRFHIPSNTMFVFDSDDYTESSVNLNQLKQLLERGIHIEGISRFWDCIQARELTGYAYQNTWEFVMACVLHDNNYRQLEPMLKIHDLQGVINHAVTHNKENKVISDDCILASKLWRYNDSDCSICVAKLHYTEPVNVEILSGEVFDYHNHELIKHYHSQFNISK